MSLYFPTFLCSGGLCDVVSGRLGSDVRPSDGFVLSRINDRGDKGGDDCMAKPCSASLGDAAELSGITSTIHLLYRPQSPIWVQNSLEK